MFELAKFCYFVFKLVHMQHYSVLNRMFFFLHFD